MGEQMEEAFPPLSVIMTLEDEIDISRGDAIVKPANQPEHGQDFDATICWMSEKPLAFGRKYILRHTTSEAKCLIKKVHYKININTLHRAEDDIKHGSQ